MASTRGSFAPILGVLLAARDLSLLLHVALPAPGGGPVPGGRFEILPAAFAGELATISALGLLAGLLARLAPRAGLALLSGGGVLLLVLSQLDLELVRWTGEHLNARWIGTYDLAGDRKILQDVVLGDPRGFFTALLLVLLPSAAVAVLAARRGAGRPSGRALVLLASGCAIGWGALPVLAPDTLLRRRARPVLVGLAEEALARGRVPSAAETRRGLALLEDLLGTRPGFFPDAGYPVWHPVAGSEAAYAGFRALPLERKPDVLLVLLESARGWELDPSRPGAAGRAPELHRLFRERGVWFPYAIATGYPSVEGLGGLFLGVPGHPSRLLLDVARRMRVLALPDVLARAGYRRELVTATGPAFENLGDWYARWFDAVHYDPSRATDDDLAARAIERLAAPHVGPVFLTLMTVATHPPLFRPPGATPKTPRDAWLAALAYTDRALGRVFDALRTSDRGRGTIVVVVGDHATTNPWQSIRLPKLGTPSAGENWTTLLVAAPGLPAGTVNEAAVSHLDVAPTLLGLLSLDVSRHFAGRDLFAAPLPPAGTLALRFNGVAAFRGDVLEQARLDDPGFFQRWRWRAYEPEPDPENGDYHHGVKLPADTNDAARAEALRTMARAWGAVLDGNRLMPARAD